MMAIVTVPRIKNGKKSSKSEMETGMPKFPGVALFYLVKQDNFFLHRSFSLKATHL